VKRNLIRAGLTVLVLAPLVAAALFIMLRQGSGVAGSLQVTPGDPPVLVEFGDFQCVHCARLALGPMRSIHRDLVSAGALRFEYRHYPFLGPESLEAALASECARDQGKFHQFHDALYGLTIRGLTLNPEALDWAARETGLDAAPFRQCLQDQTHADRVALQKREAQQLGVRGTPTLFLNGQVLPWQTQQELMARLEQAIVLHQRGGN
jgi:protein-disulfide isomerase